MCSLEFLKSVGLDNQPQILKNAELAETIVSLVDKAGLQKGCSKEAGTLIYKIATESSAKKLPANHIDFLLGYVGSLKIKTTPQYNEAVKFLSTLEGDAKAKKDAFETACGVGVEVSKEEIEKAVSANFEANRATILEQRYQTHPALKMKEIQAENPRLMWADGKALKQAVDDALLAMLGPKTEADTKKTKGGKKEDKKATKDAPAAKVAPERKFPAPEENHGEAPFGLNTKEMLDNHLKATGGKVMTRFPPEPNGYLHLGHAKAMNMNFGYASRADGLCRLRFDDTNPEAESQEYIDSIYYEIDWLGHKPFTTSYASDWFQELYEAAVKLIKSGHAYVCHQTKEQIETSRKIVAECRQKRLPLPPEGKSPWRDRPVSENLWWFEKMKKGRCAEGEAFLRYKGDLESDNPNMWDLVAYRVKFWPHPHAGDKWCIYPTYDHTHCIQDSLENISHSLCTLEFVSRQAPAGSYYWLLDALDMYKPCTWEYSRLNITHNVMSKRKLNQLVTDKFVNGWDDPRLLTLAGLRRRGFTANALNNLCQEVGVSRNDNLIKYNVLEHQLKLDLDPKAPRAFCVVEPLKVTITNWPGAVALKEAPNHPTDTSFGTRKIPLSGVVYIERSDFREEDSKDFKGLAPGKVVGLKYACLLACTEVIKDAAGEVVELKATYEDISTASTKPKGWVHWVSSEKSVKTEVRIYDVLFLAEDVSKERDWLSNLNPNSLQAKSGLAEPTLATAKPGDKFQFERLGYFCVDKDTTKDLLVVNRSCSLR